LGNVAPSDEVGCLQKQFLQEFLAVERAVSCEENPQQPTATLCLEDKARETASDQSTLDDGSKIGRCRRRLVHSPPQQPTAVPSGTQHTGQPRLLLQICHQSGRKMFTDLTWTQITIRCSAHECIADCSQSRARESADSWRIYQQFCCDRT